MSGSKLKSLMTAAFAFGLDDSLLYINQYLEYPLEEGGYREMYKEESNRFSALKSAARECMVDGCEISREPDTSINWVNVLGRTGIPYTSKGGKVKLVSGLSSDTFGSFSLDVSGEWLDSEVQLLDRKGIWQIIETTRQDRTITIHEELSVMNPVILKFNKT